ncbi:hypothetical protein K437DRAFT_23438 [Tilletiaria anomala UBC 951]|uniref:Uncharacterized protein n=1 Tax=Tilletiaria anomala (strain ATCC 24038 / CBS 436.72 / UBC 951) TaxID=1037660 RepID=A0A066VDT7_TILAU|nr:uncharacterized protein K437DRAFT_23438 [Tilletiaria anomala UBC 951]KDN38463.1 hypothetical protein K437DRAFT_23438 [Tilletiaria anomala UBC 951]
MRGKAGRRQQQQKQHGDGKATSSGKNGEHVQPVLRSSADAVTPRILILRFDKAAQQHTALARIEAFYEAQAQVHRHLHDTSGTGDARRYLTLKQAADAKVCKNYDGFNFPVAAVTQWLEAMREATTGTASNDEGEQDKDRLYEDGSNSRFWEVECNAWEIALLHHLASKGVRVPGIPETSCNQQDDVPCPSTVEVAVAAAISVDGPATDPSTESSSRCTRDSLGEGTGAKSMLGIIARLKHLDLAPDQPSVDVETESRESLPAPTYIISTLASPIGLSTVLAHERQHALFYLHARYAAACRDYFPAAESKVRTAEAARKPLHTAAIQRAIEYELALRRYPRVVWVDEWQAYLSVPLRHLDVKEFGNKCAGEVQDVAGFMRGESERAWAELAAEEDGVLPRSR